MSTEFVEPHEMPDLTNMLNELLDVTEGLANWELDLLQTLYEWDGCFTKPQAEQLKKIWERIF